VYLENHSHLTVHFPSPAVRSISEGVSSMITTLELHFNPILCLGLIVIVLVWPFLADWLIAQLRPEKHAEIHARARQRFPGVIGTLAVGLFSAVALGLLADTLAQLPEDSLYSALRGTDVLAWIALGGGTILLIGAIQLSVLIFLLVVCKPGQQPN
jgi:hypothetical protein